MKDNKDIKKASGGEDIDLPEIEFTCPELNYYDETVEVEDLNSIEKIRDRLSDVISGGESESTAHLVLGGLSHFKQKRLDSDYVSLESSDIDDFDFSIENKGKLIANPKKGEVVFVFFYYYDHADYVLTRNENFNNICFEVKSFKNEAVLTERNYSGFELTAGDASGDGGYRLEIICSDGQSFEGTVADQEDLIEEFHDYLSKKLELLILYEFISTEELTELLKYIKKLVPGDPHLEFTVEDGALMREGDLVVGDGKTWLEVSRSMTSKICYILLDDDGECEFYFNMTVPGLADCLYSLCGQQDEVDVEGFYKSVHELLKEFKEGK